MFFPETNFLLFSSKYILRPKTPQFTYKFATFCKFPYFSKELEIHSEKKIRYGESVKYLTHRVIPITGANGAVLAEKVVNILEVYDRVDILNNVLLDYTHTNTGLKLG